jgi:hypothetical protein
MGMTLIADISESHLIIIMVGLILGILLGMLIFDTRGPR